MGVSLYELHQIRSRYGDHVVLDVPNLAIEEGAILGLIGPNGSGKSTLLRLLAFLEPPHEGTILFQGKPADPLSYASLRKEVSLLLQTPYLLKRSVFENVAYGLKLRREAKISQRVREALEMVGLEPRRFAFRQWYQLSGGEAQRVALASRLAVRPRVLLLDEPTSSVDESSALLIKEATLHARSWGATLVCASHDLAWLYEVADRVVSLYEGKVVGFGAENLIYGYWKKEKEGRVALLLSDGQVIRAQSREDFEGRRTAILDPSWVRIEVESPAVSPDRNILQGTLVQMLLDKRTGQIGMSLHLGERSLKAMLPQKEVERLKLRPGLRVWAVFDVSAVGWIERE